MITDINGRTASDRERVHFQRGIFNKDATAIKGSLNLSIARLNNSIDIISRDANKIETEESIKQRERHEASS